MATQHSLTVGEDRAAIVRYGLKLEYLTIFWNSLEGLVSVPAGLFAGSIALRDTRRLH